MQGKCIGLVTDVLNKFCCVATTQPQDRCCYDEWLMLEQLSLNRKMVDLGPDQTLAKTNSVVTGGRIGC